MTERDFWQAVYLAAILSGSTSLEACEKADEAVDNFNREWSE